MRILDGVSVGRLDSFPYKETGKSPRIPSGAEKLGEKTPEGFRGYFFWVEVGDPRLRIRVF